MICLIHNWENNWCVRDFLSWINVVISISLKILDFRNENMEIRWRGPFFWVHVQKILISKFANKKIAWPENIGDCALQCARALF